MEIVLALIVFYPHATTIFPSHHISPHPPSTSIAQLLLHFKMHQDQRLFINKQYCDRNIA